VTLTGAFDDSLMECGASIRAWLSKWGRKTLRKMNIGSDDPCQAALVSKFLWGRIDPGKVKSASEIAASGSGSIPMIEIQRARAIWLVEGRSKAVAVLDEVWNLKPEGRPLKCELARAYFDMGIIQKALDVLDGEDHPEAIALRFQAQRALKGKDLGKLVELAKKTNKDKPHPATTYVLAKNLYTEAKYAEAAAMVEPMLRGAGHWTSELAELAAKAITFSDDRAHADRVLRDAERYVGTTAGLDELFEMKLVRANLNLRRGGGKFLQRAGDTLSRMKKERIPDAELLLGLSKVRFANGNGPGAGKLLREALEINPSLTKIYSQIKKNEEKLDPATIEILKKTWPDWSP
jgi:tetratricopeptide (TPR) repeat protein